MSHLQKVKLLLSYDGSKFAGWQRQNDGSVTIQETVENVLSKIFNEPVKISGSGRTDAGVHALGQVAHFLAPKDPSRYKLLRGMNALLPDSIAARSAWIAPDEFHARMSAERKTYKYHIYNYPLRSPFKRHFSTWIERPLDIQHLNASCRHLIGEHDFKSFQTAGTELKSTIRTVFSAEWQPLKNHVLEFRITGSGFLKQMVRNIVGTAMDLNLQRRDPQDMAEILKAQDRSKALGTAAPEGLYLVKIVYPDALDKRCRKL